MRYVFAMRTYKLLRAAAASKVAAADVGERVQIKRPLHGCVAVFFDFKDRQRYWRRAMPSMASGINAFCVVANDVGSMGFP